MASSTSNGGRALVVAAALCAVVLAAVAPGAHAGLTSVTTSLVKSQTMEGAWTNGNFSGNNVPAAIDANWVCSESDGGFVTCQPWRVDQKNIHTAVVIKSSGPRVYRLRAYDLVSNTNTGTYNATLSADGKVLSFIRLNDNTATGQWTKKNSTQLSGF